jgi:TolB protein
VFAAQAHHVGLWVVDTAGGRPVHLRVPAVEGMMSSPTFSPDGTQIAFLEDRWGDGVHVHVWVMDADGGNPHEILTDRTLGRGRGTLQWSPAGDRLAMQFDPYTDGHRAVYGDSEIFLFAPDGSGFTEVTTGVSGGVSPYWSPDGAQIAYTTECANCGSAYGLVIADADGSTLRAFGIGASGPWHPGVPPAN